jgi:hypothetical protein
MFSATIIAISLYCQSANKGKLGHQAEVDCVNRLVGCMKTDVEPVTLSDKEVVFKKCLKAYINEPRGK